MNVGYGIDSNAVHDLTVSLASLGAFQSGARATVVTFDLTTAEIDVIERTADDFEVDVDLVPVPADHPVRRLPTSPRVSSATYGKLVLPNVVEADRYLGLDADTLVVADLAAHELPRHAKAVAAVADGWYGHGVRRAWRLRHSGWCAAPLFNAGVLWINTAEWRRRGLTEKIARRAGRRAGPHLDQDALNWVVRGGYTRLDPAMNWQTAHLYRARRAAEEELRQAGERVRILHFTGPYRASAPGPWCEPAVTDAVLDRVRAGDPVGLREAINAARLAIFDPRRATPRRPSARGGAPGTPAGRLDRAQRRLRHR